MSAVRQSTSSSTGAMKVLATLLVVFVAGIATAKKSYHGHRLVSVKAADKQQFDVLDRMLRTAQPWLDFWSLPVINKTSVIRVPPGSYDLFMKRMGLANIGVTLKENDVEDYLQRSRMPVNGPHAETSPFIGWTGGITTHTAYKRYQEIVNLLTGMRNSFPSLVKEVDVLNTRTYEGRSISYIRLGTGGDKPVIFIEGLIHAREWIVGGSLMYFMDRLLSRYGLDAEATFLLDTYDIYVVPVTNPDGYEYSHTSQRLWRKNRSVPRNGCRGVDLNRNFDAFWGTLGVSTNCNSDIYCGPSVFSEAEAQGIRDKVSEINAGGQRLHAYLAVHSYSQLVLTPYSYDYVKPDNFVEVEAAAAEMTNALRLPFNTDYRWGHGPTTLYPVSGASDDWGMLGGGARYTFTYELRPKEANFEISPTNIIPNGYEFWLSVVALGCNMNGISATCNF
ncbi:carboxypeptidase B-like [Haliotis cracherodii]|uniref:carboxypeptidase B-like n=1 Tax=Haliotis cracherodii TaxID=6455 RepID=UPI0039ECD305